jgi:hypothetical protein
VLHQPHLLLVAAISQYTLTLPGKPIIPANTDAATFYFVAASHVDQESLIIFSF